MLHLHIEDQTNQAIMKRLFIMTMLMSAFWVVSAQPYSPMLDAETAKAHLENSKRKIETRNTSQLLSAPSETWTDGNNYYSG